MRKTTTFDEGVGRRRERREWKQDETERPDNCRVSSEVDVSRHASHGLEMRDSETLLRAGADAILKNEHFHK